MRFAEIVKLLSSPFAVQDAYLDDLPETTSVANFDPFNDAYRMALLFLESLTISEGDGGSEGVDHWRARTEIRPDENLPAQWLSIAVSMLVRLNDPFLFTRHGLRSAHEWRLIRHLAREVCKKMSWSPELQYPDFARLWQELGAGVLDEDFERARWRHKRMNSSE